MINYYLFVAILAYPHRTVGIAITGDKRLFTRYLCAAPFTFYKIHISQIVALFVLSQNTPCVTFLQWRLLGQSLRN